MNEKEWAKFAQAVPVGTQIKFSIGYVDDNGEDIDVEGILLENYPYAQQEQITNIEDGGDAKWETRNAEIWPMLRYEPTNYVARGGGPDTYLANHMHFNIWDGWYCMDDILMFDEESESAS